MSNDEPAMPFLAMVSKRRFWLGALDQCLAVLAIGSVVVPMAMGGNYLLHEAWERQYDIPCGRAALKTVEVMLEDEPVSPEVRKFIRSELAKMGM